MKSHLKQKAVKMRQEGYSLNIISQKLGIAKSTASVWLRDIVLDERAREKIQMLEKIGRQKALERIKKKKEQKVLSIQSKAVSTIDQIQQNISFDKLSAALLYWCEGEKSRNAVCFINSDPKMIVTFLTLLRSAFDLDETKFRVCLHLHGYHKDLQEITFWSKITNIPANQFFRVYKKPSTGKRKKKNYRGCASVRYHDVNILLELQSLWEYYSNKINGRVV